MISLVKLYNSFNLCSSVYKALFLLSSLKILSLSGISFSLNMICLCVGFLSVCLLWHLPCLVFSELPGYVVWYLPLTWGNSQQWLSQIILFVFLFILFSHIPFLVVLQFRDILFSFTFSKYFFFFFVFSLWKLYWHILKVRDFYSAMSIPLMSPSKLFFYCYSVFNL